MKLLLVEDELLARQRIDSIISKYSADWVISEYVQSVTEFKSALAHVQDFDLILCDIHLADGLSFRALQEVELFIPIVFITAYDQYALEAFDHNCIDYVLKPIQEDRLIKALDKASKFSGKVQKNSTPPEFFGELLRYYLPKTYKKRFLTKVGSKFVFVPVEKVAYFYSEEGITYLVESDSSMRYIVDHSLTELHQELLDPLKFYRINRSMIINLDGLIEIKPYQNGRLALLLNVKSEELVVVAREKVTEFKNWINQ
ncbi:LytR/AlgR family response regulator transcription factor [Algoriphagus hitonicola]|nr:LytTR family DNA-binding domain-containing protein [Algoriphagus hitonicola]